MYTRHEHWRGYCYDVESLTAEMAAAGLKVEECEPGVSAHEGLAQEQRVGTVEAAHQMVLEGTAG